MTANDFYPEGWSHISDEFSVPLGGAHADVLRCVNDHAFEVWCGGVGETFYSAAQAVHHIRLLKRVVETANAQ